MLTEFIAAAMRRARFEIIEDGTYFGTIPDVPGVWSNAASLSECQEELQEVLEGWILLSLKKQLPIPVLDGIDLSVEAVEERI